MLGLLEYTQSALDIARKEVDKEAIYTNMTWELQYNTGKSWAPLLNMALEVYMWIGIVKSKDVHLRGIYIN